MYRDKFDITDDDDLPDYFVSAQTLTPLEHVRMQSAAQKWVDNSISKTINCPEDISFEDFKAVYFEAYDTGCKGCTTFRPNAVTGSVLSVKPKDKPKQDAVATDVNGVALMAREMVLEGRTYKIKWPNLAHAFYITINDVVENDGTHRPFEVFINTQNVEAQAWITALTRMISAVFRRGGDVGFVATELREVFDPTGGAFFQGKYCNSLIAAIGSVLFDHMVAIDYLAPSSAPAKAEGTEGSPAVEVVPADRPTGKPCPECGEAMVEQGGCPTCISCGYSKCG
jgi:ribonucleoside-diphosphate reductase alpha chain